MKRLAILAIVPLALYADRSRDRYPREEHETIQRSFTVANGSRLVVDAVSGFVHVTGYDGNQIQFHVERGAHARSNDDLARAKRDVKLDLDQSGDTVRAVVDGPWRTRHGINLSDEFNGYYVDYDFEIRVPRATRVELKNVNDGDIQLKDISGDYTVHGLNGGIDMEGISGSGTVQTLNGKVRVKFARNPQRDCEFHTLNGSLDVYFQTPLNADLSYHTLNGGVYADFDVTTSGAGYLQRGSSRSRLHNARVGTGGPLLRFEGLNGSIRLHTTTL